jgi:hypothetical protein
LREEKLLEKNYILSLHKIYKTNWPWQIRDLGQSDVYLVKFPPHLKVEEVIGYPGFGLKKKGIWVKVEA